MCGSYALIQLSRESGSQLVNMAGYQLEVILPIVVLLTVVARALNKYTSNKPPGDSLSLCESELVDPHRNSAEN